MKTFKELALLTEAAKGLENYALVMDEQLSYLYINDSELQEALESYDMENMDEKILFVFEIKQDMGLNVFDAVYAKKGYGPIAYKIAMQLMGEMAPTQDSRITKSAQRVWKEFFDGKGSKDVNKELFGSSEGNWQRYSYSLKKELNYVKNTKNHDVFIGEDLYDEKKDLIKEMADGLLINSMRAIY
jgi:hypothetical protein